jgi:hypothetical protein
MQATSGRRAFGVRPGRIPRAPGAPARVAGQPSRPGGADREAVTRRSSPGRPPVQRMPRQGRLLRRGIYAGQ